MYFPAFYLPGPARIVPVISDHNRLLSLGDLVRFDLLVPVKAHSNQTQVFAPATVRESFLVIAAE